MRAENIKWLIGIAIALVGVIITYMQYNRPVRERQQLENKVGTLEEIGLLGEETSTQTQETTKVHTNKAYSETASFIVATITELTLDSSKVDAIRSIARTLKTKLSGEEVESIISSFSTDSFIVEALYTLSPYIQRPVSIQATKVILSKISKEWYKSKAISILVEDITPSGPIAP
ncbi:MAG: hypothetical protein KGJ87_10940 [Planctomycetota bacterium]|nr:hypothetical protein [Planctomycetota bacterium]